MTNQEIFELMERFEGSSIQSMRLKREGFSLELSKAPAVVPAAVAAVPAAPVASPVQTAAPVDGAEQQEGHYIKAGLVGTYYAAPAPDKAPFVAVGDTVKKGQTVCLLEAMKMMSEVPAPCDCVIEEILCQNGELVAYDAPMLRYRPL